MSENPWDAEGIIERLKDLYEGGTSCSGVANVLSREFGVRISRNSVIGKARRMGFASPNLPRTNPNAEKRRRANAGLSSIAASIYRKPRNYYSAEAVADVAPLHVSLTDLRPGSCRYPYGENPYTFCGCEVIEGSYCGPHYALTHRDVTVIARPAEGQEGAPAEQVAA